MGRLSLLERKRDAKSGDKSIYKNRKHRFLEVTAKEMQDDEIEKKYLVFVMNLPDGEDKELIVNGYKNMQKKIDYVNRVYNDDLVIERAGVELDKYYFVSKNELAGLL